VKEVRTLLAESARKPGFETNMAVALASSTCIGALPGPYYVLPPQKETFPWISFLNDAFFTDTAGGNGPS